MKSVFGRKFDNKGNIVIRELTHLFNLYQVNDNSFQKNIQKCSFFLRNLIIVTLIIEYYQKNI